MSDLNERRLHYENGSLKLEFIVEYYFVYIAQRTFVTNMTELVFVCFFFFVFFIFYFLFFFYFFFFFFFAKSGRTRAHKSYAV